MVCQSPDAQTWYFLASTHLMAAAVVQGFKAVLSLSAPLLVVLVVLAVLLDGLFLHVPLEEDEEELVAAVVAAVVLALEVVEPVAASVVAA